MTSRTVGVDRGGVGHVKRQHIDLAGVRRRQVVQCRDRRAVATTTSPAATAASAIARPKPLFAPVISQTLFIRSSLGLAALAGP